MRERPRHGGNCCDHLDLEHQPMRARWMTGTSVLAGVTLPQYFDRTSWIACTCDMSMTYLFIFTRQFVAVRTAV
jgi:hypothetical protein